MERRKINSRQKGARGERELAHVLMSHGYSARRGQQFSGANGDADVVGIDGLHIEVKRVERLNIEQAMEQSRNDARLGEIPVVMHRKNHEPWKVTMDIADFLRIWKEYENGHTRDNQRP